MNDVKIYACGMDELLTIDELAAVTQIPTRTIRQYQTFGLLAPPSRTGRVGRYGPPHRERLGAIMRLQERGYSLAGMRDLFDAWESGREFRTVVGFDDGQPEAPVDEATMRITQEQLITMVPALSKPANRRTASRAGLIIPGSEKAQWLVRSPSALAMFADLVSSGVPVTRAFRMFELLESTLGALGRNLAVEFSVIEPAGQRAALLQRNRPLLGKAVATILIAAIGEALPSDDAKRIRIGATQDQRGRSSRVASRSPTARRSA